MTAQHKLPMSWSEWFALDGVDLADLIRKGKITTNEVIAQTTAGVQRVDGELEGVLELFEDVGQNADANSPNRSGTLYGVPIFLKDLGSRMAQRAQESGSRLLRGNISDVTDPLINNYLRAGLIPFGRSTTPEFGMTFDTSTNYLGEVKVTRNPWNLEHTPGGSSGGSAALVTAGVTPISMATDGGGSTRIPASYCGLVGLKASRGRVPMPLNHSEYTLRHVAEGVVTRTVRDSAAVLDYLHAKPVGGTFYPMASPRGSYLESLTTPPRQMKIALSTGRWGRDVECDGAVVDRIHAVARVLESLGHNIQEIEDDKLCDWELMWNTYITQWICGRVMYLSIAQLHGVNPAEMEGMLSPMVFRHFDKAQSYTTLDLLQAIAGNNTITRSFGSLFENWDILLCPTHAIRVPIANGPYSLLRDEPLESWLSRLVDACRYTMPGNEAGLPGISIPAGLDNDGLPVGAMLYAGQGREDLVLRLAAALEVANPEWFARMPLINVDRT